MIKSSLSSLLASLYILSDDKIVIEFSHSLTLHFNLRGYLDKALHIVTDEDWDHLYNQNLIEAIEEGLIHSFKIKEGKNFVSSLQEEVKDAQRSKFEKEVKSLKAENSKAILSASVADDKAAKVEAEVNLLKKDLNGLKIDSEE